LTSSVILKQLNCYIFYFIVPRKRVAAAIFAARTPLWVYLIRPQSAINRIPYGQDTHPTRIEEKLTVKFFVAASDRLRQITASFPAIAQNRSNPEALVEQGRKIYSKGQFS
jgi:hypothetical protein